MRSRSVSQNPAEGRDAPPTFDDFVRHRSLALLRLAYLLTGDQSSAEDLLQTALEKAYRRWRHIGGLENPEAYLRQMLVYGATDRWRRLRRSTQEILSRPIASDVGRDFAQVDDRDQLMRALRGLPKRQRAVIVLRYWEGLSESETADSLGCSVGTVKSHASRGMARLREELYEPAGLAPRRGLDEH